ncbi:hypothetical protein CVT25_005233 [Psilocybe cyanescens]|uniref:DJ-1/PfpI domain-containing protein n=1 Tax=Psilocybe cyanescens TaxID=93625 RepID=A0A409XS17_PSICY|nr:hypothetical protein CVT25_005233 [Psilocybe cyanescens]
MSAQVLNLGLILIPGYQWLDGAGPVDYLNNHSNALASLLRTLPKSTYDKAPIMKWHYISSDLTPVQATSGPLQLPSCTYADCPPLDCIFIPGPTDILSIPKGFTEFIKTRLEDPKLIALLMICTASLLIAPTGILDGREVASNKLALRDLAAAGLLDNDNYKKVKWVGNKRFTVDGKLWSSAGITAGLDLAAEFARVHFAKEIGVMAQEIAEYKPNPADPDPFAYILEGVKL